MKLTDDQIKQLDDAIERALDEVYMKDLYLIENQVHERTIVARFCIYFQQALVSTDFANYNLDFEYNKNHSDPKRTVNFRYGTYPDVILHQRGSNKENILIIEFKTWWKSNTRKDIEKLIDFTEHHEQYKYSMGYSIVFKRARNEVKKVLVMNGEVCHE